MPDLKEKRVELILQQLEELPTLPAVALRILEIASDESSSARDLAALIASDPSLSARILQLVHRADSGVRGEVDSVERAIVLLGFETVRSAVLAVTVFQTLGGAASPASSHFPRENFWKHCLAVGCCAELLAEQMPRDEGRIEPASAFLCGLLHDIGKIALDAMLPKSYSRVVEAAELLRGNIADVERLCHRRRSSRGGKTALRAMESSRRDSRFRLAARPAPADPAGDREGRPADQPDYACRCRRSRATSRIQRKLHLSRSSPGFNAGDRPG